MEPSQIGSCHLVICIEVSSMSSYGLTAHFFLAQNNILLSRHPTIYLSVHLLDDILVACSFDNI